MISFSEALHAEFKRKGVRVTALCPGPVPTEFQARAGIPSGSLPRVAMVSPERVAREGYRGLQQGRRVVVPGLAIKAAPLLARLLPRSVLLKLMHVPHAREIG